MSANRLGVKGIIFYIVVLKQTGQLIRQTIEEITGFCLLSDSRPQMFKCRRKVLAKYENVQQIY